MPMNQRKRCQSFAPSRGKLLWSVPIRLRYAAFFIWAATIMLMVIPATASEPPSEARTLFAQGEKAYNEARYEDAITLFLAAFDEEPHPELLLNVGQAAERLEHRTC